MHAPRSLATFTTACAATAMLSGALVTPVARPAAPTRRCTSRDLRIREGSASQGAGGSFILVLSYRNVSRATCQTGGWPRVTLFTRDRRALPATHRRHARTPNLRVRLGATVYSKVMYSESPTPGHRCRRVVAARIRIPDGRQAPRVRLPRGSAWCGGSITVAPLARTVRSATP